MSNGASAACAIAGCRLLRVLRVMAGIKALAVSLRTPAKTVWAITKYIENTKSCFLC